MPVFPACPKCGHRVPVTRIFQRMNPEYVCGRCGERLRIHRQLFLPAFIVPIILSLLVFFYLEERRYGIVALLMALPVALLFTWLSARVRRQPRRLKGPST